MAVQNFSIAVNERMDLKLDSMFSIFKFLNQKVPCALNLTKDFGKFKIMLLVIMSH